MKTSGAYIWLAVGAIILLLAAAVYFMDDDEKRFNWEPTYSQEETQPYDLSLFRKSLAQSYGDEFIELTEPLYTAEIDEYEDACFIWVGSYTSFDSSETAKLMAFAERGNRVLIATEYVSEFFYWFCPDSSFQEFYSWPSIRAKTAYQDLRFAEADSALPISFTIKNEVERYDWTYFDLDVCGDVDLDTLGSFTAIDNAYVNFISLPQGEGEIQFHCTPLIFTNYHFRRKAVFDHVNQILGKSAKKTLIYYNPEYENFQNFGDQAAESPLSFILSQRSLRYAWYGLLILALLYMLNGIRRDQRALPIVLRPENNSAAYLALLSKLYRKKGNHKYLVGVQEKLLRRYLFRKYHLPLGSADADFFREARIRLNMTEGEIQLLFNTLHRGKNNSTITEAELMKIQEQLKAFYAKCP